jgi:hypothetical protein
MESLGRVSAALTSSIITNSAKYDLVSKTIDKFNSPGKTFLGLFDEGGGRRNAMSIINGTSNAIKLLAWYLHWGHVKIPPEPYLHSMTQDECLFHNAGSWACTGSSGIVTYELNYQTNLHILWECPFNFDLHDNYIGLMLTSDSRFLLPNKPLFKCMFEDSSKMGKVPNAESTYDLVCCGPGKANSKEAGGSKPWGFSRPCKVHDAHYAVYATMGDRHASVSKITIIEK